MLKDDRMMGVLTFVVIMVAVGTMVQRLDFFERLFGAEGAAAVLNADMAEVRATEPLRVDVLANDTGVSDPGRLTVTTPPACGRASARGGEIHYRGTMGCIGVQTVGYGLAGEDARAELRITVLPTGGEDEPRPAAAAEPAEPRLAAAPESPAPAVGGGSAARTDPVAEANPTGGEAPSAAAEIARAAPAMRGEDAAAPGAAGPGAVGSGATAARPGPDCALPPTLTLAVGPGAVTGVEVSSPCHARTVAELAYDGLRFAIPLDARGAGSLEVPGFQRSTEATIAFARGEPMEFNLPFEGIERVERVAIAWEEPSGLALNAFEFGARPGSGGHLTPGEPRSFEAVRREGGGWLASYRPEDGLGQRIDVYSFWRRHAGPAGVVRLALDPAGGTGSAACRGAGGGGTSGAAGEGADYVVLRTAGGRLERSRLGRVAPLDCAELASGPGRYIENAVDDLIVRRN